MTESLSLIKERQSILILTYREHQYKNLYEHTSAVVTLPGGIKRDMYKIKDDKKFINKKNLGHLYKLQRDYGSDIPGLGVNHTLFNIEL
jgi:hypothetical protein